MSKLKVSVIQSDIIWGDKQANYNKLENTIANIDQDTDVIVMCEMFNTGFIMNPTDQASTQQDIVNWMYSQVKGKIMR